MHALHVTVHIENGVTHIAVNNLAREDSHKEEQDIIKSIEDLLAVILKQVAKPGDQIKEIQ